MDFLITAQAKDVMTKHVISVYPKTSIKELVGIFIENNISGAPVLDEDQQVIGFVSQIDIVELDMQSEDYLDSWIEATGGYVRDIMVPIDTFAHETDSVASVIDKMCPERLHRMVILNEHDRVSGIITTMDIMCYIRQTFRSA